MQLKSVINHFIGFSDSTINHLMFYKLGLQTFYGQAFITEFCELADSMISYSKNSFIQLFTGEIKFESSLVWYEERSDFSASQVGVNRIMHEEKHGYEVLKGSGQVSGRLLGGCIESLLTFLRTQKLKKF